VGRRQQRLASRHRAALGAAHTRGAAAEVGAVAATAACGARAAAPHPVEILAGGGAFIYGPAGGGPAKATVGSLLGVCLDVLGALDSVICRAGGGAVRGVSGGY
jgi:hypothetical protein